MNNSTAPTLSKIALVNTLTAQLIRNGAAQSRSQAMKSAWAVVLKGGVSLLIFRKKSNGQITRRVVSENWTAYQAPKGGKSNLVAGQIVFADLAKFIAGEANCIISAHRESIIFYA
jgi:hypothetical protein